MGLFDRTMQWTIHWMKSTKFPFAKRKRKIPVVRRTCYVNSLYGRFNIPLSRSHVKSTVCVCVCVCICVCVCMCVHWTTISLCNTALYKCIRPGFPFRSAFMFADQPEKIVFLCQECPTEDFKPLWHGNTVHLIYLSVCDDCDPDHARYTSDPNPCFFSSIAEPIAKIEELAKIFPLSRLKCWNFSKIFDRFVNRRRESIRSRDFRFWGTKVTKKKKKKKEETGKEKRFLDQPLLLRYCYLIPCRASIASPGHESHNQKDLSIFDK